MQVAEVDQTESINRAFSKQSLYYDNYDLNNPVLQDMRRQVYKHVSPYLAKHCSLLELNAGTGIDSLHFARQGHRVHATDLSDGMISQIKDKIVHHHLEHQLSCEQLSFEQLHILSGRKFDFIFSNFGGLNCIEDLSKVTVHMPDLLKPGSFVTWVIMPPVSLWELAGIFKGRTQAFRRIKKNGVMAHLEGEYFRTYYHSLSKVKSAFGPKFKFVKAEGLCALSPPPSRPDISVKYPWLYHVLRTMDSMFRTAIPFNRWADHLIVTFQFLG